MMKKNDKADTIIKIGLFLISPFISFLYSLRNMKAKSSYVVFFLFCVFFGMAFTVGENYTGDSVRYIQQFKEITNYENSKYFEMLDSYREFDEGKKDFYFITIAFIVSRITSNYHALFAVLAMFFAFFQLKSFRFLTNEEKFNTSFTVFLLAFIFIFSNSIFHINGVRFWTATWVGVYCIFKIFRNNNKKYFLLAFITPFIHVSFFAYLFVIAIAYFTKKYERFWMVMLLISIPISEVSIGVAQGMESILPPFISKVIRSYTDVQYIEMRQEASVWYVQVFRFLEQTIVCILMLFFYQNKKQIKLLAPQAMSIYSFLLVWITFVNFTMAIPSLGVRFFWTSIPFIVYIWLVAFNSKKYRPLLYIFLVCFSYSFSTVLYRYTQVTELGFYIYNPFYLIYHYLFI